MFSQKSADTKGRDWLKSNTKKFYLYQLLNLLLMLGIMLVSHKCYPEAWYEPDGSPDSSGVGSMTISIIDAPSSYQANGTQTSYFEVSLQYDIDPEAYPGHSWLRLLISDYDEVTIASSNWRQTLPGENLQDTIRWGGDWRLGSGSWYNLKAEVFNLIGTSKNSATSYNRQISLYPTTIQLTDRYIEYTGSYDAPLWEKAELEGNGLSLIRQSFNLAGIRLNLNYESDNSDSVYFDLDYPWEIISYLHYNKYTQDQYHLAAAKGIYKTSDGGSIENLGNTAGVTYIEQGEYNTTGSIVGYRNCVEYPFPSSLNIAVSDTTRMTPFNMMNAVIVHELGHQVGWGDVNEHKGSGYTRENSYCIMWAEKSGNYDPTVLPSNITIPNPHFCAEHLDTLSLSQ
ncbi:MAG: hypothetical protein JSU77_06190 [Fidelibacterota bacterium]|nr:MAG: hypothetical protein JSU77_06190 [Candidatus Neomarinimicrobiota bacterium]